MPVVVRGGEGRGGSLAHQAPEISIILYLMTRTIEKALGETRLTTSSEKRSTQTQQRTTLNLNV